MMNSADRVPITSAHPWCYVRFGSSPSRLDRIAITSHFTLARRVFSLPSPVVWGQVGLGMAIASDWPPYVSDVVTEAVPRSTTAAGQPDAREPVRWGSAFNTG